MSNNPFLKSKDSNQYNNRFNFLDSDDENKKSTSKNKKQSPYDSSNNSFTKPFSSRDHYRRDNNKRDRNIRDNNRIDKESKLPEQNKNNHLDLNNVELFPMMNSKDIIDTSFEISNVSSTKFKDILNNVMKDDTELIEQIKPGWVEISRIKA